MAADLPKIPHEETMKEKASYFVGRTDLVDLMYKHCCSQVDGESGVMVVAGSDGQGKSALMARVATKCLDELRQKGDFVFVHAVGSCTQSDDLEKMLQMHQSLHHDLIKINSARLRI